MNTDLNVDYIGTRAHSVENIGLARVFAGTCIDITKLHFFLPLPSRTQISTAVLSKTIKDTRKRSFITIH